MPSGLPPEKTVARDLRYCGARAAADPDTKDLSPAVRAAAKKHRVCSDAVRDAEDGLTDAEALFDEMSRRVEEGVLALHFKFTGLYESDKHEEIVRVFERRPKTIINTTGKEKANAVFSAIAGRAADQKTDLKLKDSVAKFVKLTKGLEESQKAVDAAKKVMNVAERAETSAREEGVIILRRTRALLTDRYPDNLARVARYFLKAAKKPKKSKDKEEGQRTAPETEKPE